MAGVLNPVHVYAAAGTYAVYITVGNSAGKTSYTANVTVAIAVDSVDFTSAIGGFTVWFKNTTNFKGDALWDFGDGTTSTDQNPVHTFPANNTYTVSLTVGGVTKTHSVTIDTEILLSWTDNSGGTGSFKLEHSLDNSSWTQFATTIAGVTSYGVSKAVDGIDSKVLNYFRVRAHGAGGDSAYTSAINIQCGG